MGEKVKGIVKKFKKRAIISIIIPIMIVVLIAGIYFAILDAIVGIIMDIVTTLAEGVLEFLKNPFKFASSAWGDFSNWLDRTIGIGDKFNPNEYEDRRPNLEASIVITQENFEKIIYGKQEDDAENTIGLEQAVDRDSYGVGLEDFYIKKMLLAYYRGMYFDDTNILIELKDDEDSSELAKPFIIISGDKDKGWGEDGKRYLKTMGMIDVKLQGTNTNLIYYPEKILNEIFEKEYKKALENGKVDYANSVLNYLKKCYTYSETGIKMYGYIVDSTFDYIEYCNDGMPVILDTSDSNVMVQMYDIEYNEKISQFATPLEFMTTLMEITGSQDFINNFILMVGESNYIKMELNEIVYEEKTEEIINSVRDTNIVGTNKGDAEQKKEIVDKSNVIKSRTKFYKEIKYDLVVTKVVNWYVEIENENEKKITTTYTTIDEEENEINISSENEKISIAQDSIQNEYNFSTNPKVFEEIPFENFYLRINKNTGVKKFGDDANALTEEYVDYMKRLYFNQNDEKDANWYITMGVLGDDWYTLESSEEYCLARQLNYILKKPRDTYNNYNAYTAHMQELSKYTFDQLTCKDTEITKSVLKTVINQSYVQIVGKEKDRTDLFLALLSGEDAKYEVGDAFKAKKDGGVIVKYNSLYGKEEEGTNKKVGAGEMLENGADMLFQLLERSPNTHGLADPMRYIMYRYSGNDYGVTEFTFEIYDPNAFAVQPKGGTTILMEYIHELEGTTNVKLNADKSKYVIYKDDAGNLLVGYGVNITTGGYGALFEQAGYSLEEGTEVKKEFVNYLEEEEIGDLVEQVREKTKNLDLKEYQIHALTVKARNCGITETFGSKNGKTFEQAYKEYWNESTDNLFKNKNNSANFNHSLYTEYMSKSTSGGTINQRKSEWTLFQTGYYKEIDNWYPDTGEMLEKCVEVMNDLLANNVRYSKTDLVWKNIEASNDFSKYSCVCCTYVTAVIYRAGILPVDYINRYNYHTPEGVNQMLEKAGWTLVSASEAQPGDIGTFTISKSGDKDFRHGFIYAGGNEIWDQSSGCISTEGEPPKRGTKSNWSYYVNNAGNLKVWRMP